MSFASKRSTRGTRQPRTRATGRDWSDWLGDWLLTRYPYGLALLAVSGFTLLSLLSPGGTITRPWANRALAVAGWGTGPLALLTMIVGFAVLRGPGVGVWSLIGRLLAALVGSIAAASLFGLLVSDPAGLPWSWLETIAEFGAVSGDSAQQALGRPGALLVLLGIVIGGGGLAAGIRTAGWLRAGRAAVIAGQYLLLGLWVLGDLAVLGLWYLSRSIAAGVRLALRALGGAARAFQAYRAARTQMSAEPAGQVVGEVLVPPPTRRQLANPMAALAGGGDGWDANLGSKALLAPSEAPAAGWLLPSTAILSTATAEQISEAETADKARVIEETLASFNVPVKVVETRVGPTVSQFGLRPAPGITVQRIKRLQDDLMLALAAPSVRVETPVPGRPVVGIEIPNSGIALVGLREILESDTFARHKGMLKVALGRDVDGRPRVGDLAKMPHLLLAGQTGSGKSACLNSIIASLLFQGTPDTLQFLMIDPKMVELIEYEGIPHLRYPVVVELSEAAKVLLWAVEEMERRYQVLKEAGFRNIEGYNRSLDPDGDVVPLPYLVLIIDELADLMMFAPDDIEPTICRLTAKSRAVGIHLVVATQRPSVDVVTGLIKANMPSRIAFAVSSHTDSRVILDAGGAESLLGRGDMLYLPHDQGRPVRVQGTWVADDEISELVEFWKAQGEPEYVNQDEIAHLQLKQEKETETARDTSMMDQALTAIEALDHVSISWLQRKLSIGYPRAARLMDDLVERGIVEKGEGPGRAYRVVPGAPFAARRGEWDAPDDNDDA